MVLSQDDREPGAREIVLQSWRLGPDAPVANLLPFMDDTNAAVRWRAVFALGRLRAPAAAARMLLALRDEDIYIRSLAARALSRGYAQAARLSPATVGGRARPTGLRSQLQVRINALGALGTYHDSTLAVRIVPQLNDPVPNVQVAAAEAMGNLGGSEAVKGLGRLAGARRGRSRFAERRSWRSARWTRAASHVAASAWRKSADWRERAAAAEGTAAGAPGADPWFLADRDGRVVAAGLQAWSTHGHRAPTPPSSPPPAACLNHADAGVRSVAADIVTRAADPADLSALAAMYARTASRLVSRRGAFRAQRHPCHQKERVRAPRREWTGNFSRRPPARPTI